MAFERYPSRQLIVAAAATLVMAFGCASDIKLVPGEAGSHTHEIAHLDKEAVFDGVVAVAHARGFSIAVVEKASGVMRLEPMKLSPAELDRFCEVPLVHTDSGKPATTFAKRDQELREDDQKGLGGAVELEFLVSDRAAETVEINLRSTFSVSGPKKTVACSSTGAYEKDLFVEIDRELLSP